MGLGVETLLEGSEDGRLERPEASGTRAQAARAPHNRAQPSSRPMGSSWELCGRSTSTPYLHGWHGVSACALLCSEVVHEVSMPLTLEWAVSLLSRVV